MKKAILNLFLVGLMVLAGNQQVFAKEKFSKGNIEFSEAEIKRFAEIEARIMEINALDISGMTHQEKKELRTELKDLKKEAKQSGGGLYISTGALIIILILLIILL
ncbi:hypothetical protein [Cecembia rubra]|uniref:Seryl-tRNA synthetase n=1 Tax=Cecembia rubra TaxID=1485585 RepID=A0A2P8DTC4_9BACT|nr:hypothetical protein [Cecembia rubra]PSL00467.1 hypothetical protein CLV48_11519 [Cecembia rubra]